MKTLRKLEQTLDPGGGPGLTTTLIVVALICGTVFLTWADKVNGDAFVALASTIVGGVLVTRGIATKNGGDPGE